MSGGSYDYMYCRIEDYYVGHMKDIELNDLMKDIVELVHDLEWADSSDISDEDYFETVIKFKNKWFKQNRNDRLKTYIDNKLEQTQKELYNLIGKEVENEGKNI